jgi:hypothetical protein
MATRHETPNLERRGNVFPWRTRIPVSFLASREASRLSLSLCYSDHKKAGYVGRRLNALMFNLKVKPAAGMTTRDQLETLFRAARDRADGGA